MTSERISVVFTPENGNERVAETAADVDVAPTKLSPKFVHGRFVEP